MTTTATPPETHGRLTSAEVAELAREKQSPKAVVGMVGSYVGMGLIVMYCMIPFYWMIVSALRDPSQGRSTEFIPSPVSVGNFRACSPARTTSAAR